jgi:putative acyl-CoA dehydrogenase
MATMVSMEFYQSGPSLKNTYDSDSVLQDALKRSLPADAFGKIEKHLRHVGELAVGDWLRWSREAEANKPKLVQFDAFGRRRDEIVVSDGWRKLEAAAATEGIVASGYTREFGEFSRVYQAALLYLFHPSSAFVSCPLAMTDGAARAIELYGDEELKANAFKHLTSRDPKTFWTSGQWMTEKTGGSDVSETSTVAKRSGHEWTLHGTKWFTSATTSQMAMLLARPEGAEAGSRGLSLFYTELRDKNAALKNIEILRLKDKLGTDALPTAELQLVGTPARLVGGEGNGVRKISSLFNITRVYNSVCSVGHLRRGLDLAQSYSRERRTFGRPIIEHPLHQQTLSDVEASFARAFSLTLFVAHLLGRDEVGTATERERLLLRALTPISKLYSARVCMSGTSEVVEMFGGVGYIEDSGIPRLLRDAQVFSIWEGTTNVLALDFLRAVDKEEAKRDFIAAVEERFSEKNLGAAWLEARQILLKPRDEAQARRLSFLIAEATTNALRNSLV